MALPARRVEKPNCQLNWEWITAHLIVGDGDPEGVVTAAAPCIFLRRDGGAGSTLYVKESGAGDTGWDAK